MDVESNATIDFKVFLKLNEPEARALAALTTYGDKAFLEMFYKTLGKSYLEPHESGLKSLFKSIDRNLPKHLERMEETRKIFKSKI